MNRKRPPDPERTKRLRARAEAHAGLDRLAGRVKPPRGAPAPSDQALRTLAEWDLGVEVVTLAGQTIGLLEPVHPGPHAPVKLRLYASAAQSKPLRVSAPSWLAVVRMMPCAICGKGRDFAEQLRIGVSQSEANHYPGRGRSGGGSDLETHPACGPSPFGCHGRITDGKVPDATQAAAVAAALHCGMQAVRLGLLPPAILLAVGVEAVLGNG